MDFGCWQGSRICFVRIESCVLPFIDYMAEHNISFLSRTFGELVIDKTPEVRDPYKIMATLNPSMREAVLHNPSGFKDDETCQILAVDGDVVVGATNPFSGRLLINGEVVPCQNGSYLYSHDDYRKDNVGGELFLRITNLHPTKNCFFVGISQMAIGLYRALKYSLFEFPRLIYLRKSRCVVQSILHSEASWTKPLIGLADIVLWLHRQIIKVHNSIFYREYSIDNVKECPIDVERIVIQDKHPYKELHDKAWFDWSLNYSISEDERTLRRLYVIKKNGKIEAFFLLKQEFFEKASSRGFKNVYLGSIMEWGIGEDSHLTEKDIVLMSLSNFDNNVDGIQYATTEHKVAKLLKKWLFVGIGHANTGVRIRSIKDNTLKDINNWRLRLGGSDTVLN